MKPFNSRNDLPQTPSKGGGFRSASLRLTPDRNFRMELDYYFNWHVKNPVEMLPFGFCEGGTIALKVDSGD